MNCVYHLNLLHFFSIFLLIQFCLVYILTKCAMVDRCYCFCCLRRCFSRWFNCMCIMCEHVCVCVCGKNNQIEKKKRRKKHFKCFLAHIFRIPFITARNSLWTIKNWNHINNLRKQLMYFHHQINFHPSSLSKQFAARANSLIYLFIFFFIHFLFRQLVCMFTYSHSLCHSFEFDSASTDK